LRSNLLVKEGLADVDALLQNRNEGLNLLNCSRSSRALSFLLSLLTLQRLELGSMLRDLVQQESFVGGDSLEARTRRRVKLGERIEVLGDRGERSVEPGDVKLRGDEIVSQLSALGLIHGGVELDQRIPGLYLLPIADVDRPNHAGFKRLDHLGSSTRDYFAVC